jgi:glycosyltransferase involved in cell wall biosynthesis
MPRLDTAPPPPGAGADDGSPLAGLLGEFLDPDWYRERYPDVAASDLDPYRHFIRYGAAERRDPNRFFDSAWYVEHYPDVAASGFIPLLHYVQSGVGESRNPHPRFDGVWYVEQHPDAAANPLLYHLRVGMARGYRTEKSIDIADYLPSEGPAVPVPAGVFADVVIPLHRGTEAAMRCIRSVLTDRAFPLARIIVVDDRSTDPELRAWLRELAAEGQIHLIRNRRHLGFAASVNLGVDAAVGHDVVVLRSDAEVPPGWLRRLTAQAYSRRNVATVSPLSDYASFGGNNDGAAPAQTAATQARIDALCQTVNAGRSVRAEATTDHCTYISRAALVAFGPFGREGFSADETALGDFCARASAGGWGHRIACDTFVARNGPAPATLRQLDRATTPLGAIPMDAIPFHFAVTTALFRDAELPVILMVSHSFGGGVRLHIDSLVERYRDTANVLLLEGSDRGAALSVPSSSLGWVLTLPAERLDDMVTLLRSANISRVHIHHLLEMDMDIRVLIQRLGVQFDLTVHDYYAICPQISLLRWDEGVYCGEPGPADCNACIAERSSHNARDIVSWRRSRVWQFLDADRVICPSADVKARLDRHAIGDRGIVVPHEQQTDPVWTTDLPQFPAPPLRIVLLGVLANHKGARAVAEVAEAAAPGTIELHLIGHLEDSFPQSAVKLIKVSGPYQNRDLSKLLRRIDPHVFWLPSSAPETYSFTLSTAIATGRPIVATDHGSFTERLAGRPLTWLVDHLASSKDWLAAFDQVRTVLRDRPKLPPVARPLRTADFYADRYLAPASPQASAAAGRRPKIVIVPERYGIGGLTPCAYIRLLQPLDHPMIGGRFDITLADAETIFACEADIIVTQRYAIPDLQTVDRLAAHARRTGAKLVFDLDDDLLAIPATHPDASTLRPLAKVVLRMLAIADTVWVSTQPLAERLASVRPDAVVVANGLDERIWAHGQPATPVLASSVGDDPIRILCMGTTTHQRDFALIEPALIRLRADYGPRVVVDVLGMTRRNDLPRELSRVDQPTQASRSYPGFVNWLTRRQPGWHIGVAPLLDTAFNRSKSPIKAMDYAAMGLAVLASDMAVYRGSIADGPAGQLVANDPAAWHAALDWLVRDQDLRKSTALRAREAFLAGASLASQAETRRAALEQLLPDRRHDADVGLQGAACRRRLAGGRLAGGGACANYNAWFN